jgi:hypothetical protein
MNDSSAETFDNDPVDAASIPDYRDADFEPVASTFRRYVVLSTIVTWAPLLLLPAGILLFQDAPRLVVSGIAAGVAGLALVVGVYRWIDAGYRGWALREHDIIARHGILWRSVITLPVARIQHVETASGPLERSQQLSRLKLFTAGGITADLTVIGLADRTADRLREYLVEQIRLRDAGTSGPPAPDDDDRSE